MEKTMIEVDRNTKARLDKIKQRMKDNSVPIKNNSDVINQMINDCKDKYPEKEL